MQLTVGRRASFNKRENALNHGQETINMTGKMKEMKRAFQQTMLNENPTIRSKDMPK